jgi:hypothetical protein
MMRFAATALCLTFAFIARADTILLTLDGNLSAPDYAFYSYTDTSGHAQDNIPISPYITYLSGGVYNNTPVYSFCYDFNSPTDVGNPYPGVFELFTDPATMEATYLVDQLNAQGMQNAPLAIRGAISLAIWQIMNPSSTTSLASFPDDPAAQPWIAAAVNAVNNGLWSVDESNRYPTWVPNDPSIQRFGIVFQNEPAAPEPATLAATGLALVLFGIWRRKSRGAIRSASSAAAAAPDSPRS